MSFTRINVAGWAVGAKLTSAQMNALDIDHANAADKTTAGDTISGLWTFAATSEALFTNPNTFNLGGPGAGLAGTFQALSANIAGAILAQAAGAIAAAVINGISDGGVSKGIGPTVNKGIWDGGIVGGIAGTVAQGIMAYATKAITSSVIGGIQPGISKGITDGGLAAGIDITAISGLRVESTGSIEALAGGLIQADAGATIAALGALISIGGLGGTSGNPFVLNESVVVIASTGTTTISAADQANPMMQIQVTAGPSNPLTGNITIDLNSSPTGSIYFLDLTQISSLAGHTISVKNGSFTSAAMTPTQAIIAICTAGNRVACVAL